MGKAIGANFEKAGNQVVYAGRDFKKALGDIVVLAVPYGALEAIIGAHADELKENILIDITNPVNFDTFDSLVVPVDSSAAQEIQKKLPETVVVKAFNTTFAVNHVSGLVGGKEPIGGKEPTIVLVASDDAEAKQKIKEALEGSLLSVLDAGTLKRARELEAMGFLQISMAARKQFGWTGGFAVIK